MKKLIIPLILLTSIAYASDFPDFPMSLYWTITVNWTWLGVWSSLIAFCWNTSTQIWTVDIIQKWVYWATNSNYLLVSSCSSNIFLQARVSSSVTSKVDTWIKFTSWIIQEYKWVFTDSGTLNSVPASPSALRAVPVSYSEINLSWEDNSVNETGFQVYNGTTLLDTITTNHYLATWLSEWTSYTFKVYAFNSNWQSTPIETTAKTLISPKEVNPLTWIVPTDNSDASQVSDQMSNSSQEIILRDNKDDILSNISFISSLISSSSSSDFASLKWESWDVVLSKQTIQFDLLPSLNTWNTDFDSKAKETSSIVETTMFLPVDTSDEDNKKVLIIFPKQTLITSSTWWNIEDLEIMPPVIKSENSVTVPTETNKTVTFKSALEIPTNLAWIKLSNYIDICMPSNWASESSSVYYSNDWVNFISDSAAINKKIIWDQFCFQINHLTSFLVANVESTSQSTTTSSSSWWWGWWGGWGWSVVSQTSWTYIIPSNRLDSLETTDSLDFRNVKAWMLTLNVQMKDLSNKFVISIPSRAVITTESWATFSWIILAPDKTESAKLPLVLWKFAPLLSYKVWSADWKQINLSKPFTVAFSTKWFPLSIKRDRIKIYSFDGQTYQEETQNLKYLVASESISVEANHMSIFSLVVSDWVVLSRVTAPFKDIQKHWAKSYIEALFAKWALSSKDKYYPEDNLKRAELVKLVIEVLWLWTSKELSNLTFTDIDTKSWYASYLSKAVALWLVSWDKWLNTFRPWDSINRAEAVKIVLLAIKANTKDVQGANFDDVSKWSWYSSYVDFASSKWIVSGYWNNKFWPSDSVTRWQIAKILIKSLELK